MRPMTLPEGGVTTPLVSLGDLGNCRAVRLLSAESKLGIEDYVREIVSPDYSPSRSSLPGLSTTQMSPTCAGCHDNSATWWSEPDSG